MCNSWVQQRSLSRDSSAQFPSSVVSSSGGTSRSKRSPSGSSDRRVWQSERAASQHDMRDAGHGVPQFPVTFPVYCSMPIFMSSTSPALSSPILFLCTLLKMKRIRCSVRSSSSSRTSCRSRSPSRRPRSKSKWGRLSDKQRTSAR